MPTLREWPRHQAPPRPIVALGVAVVPGAALPELRKAPAPPGGPAIPPGLIKHADDQSVLGLAAVLQAVDHARVPQEALGRWGVLAAPRFLGRVAASAAISRHARLGPASVSPLIIPTLSLHSMAGTISLALGARGTNFGVGGGPGHLGEALLAALAACETPGHDGLWVVATEWSPEPVPDGAKRSLVETTGYATAFGVVPALTAGLPCWTLRVVPAAAVPPAVSCGVPGLVRFLTDATASPHSRRWFCPLADGLAIELAEGVGGMSLLDLRDVPPRDGAAALAG